MAIIKLDGGYNALPISYKRGNPIPLDTTAVWYDFAALETYAAEGVTAYVGQVLTYVDSENNTATAYVIADTAGTLEPIGTAPVGDTKSIVVDEETGTISLKGISALVFTREVDVLGEDGQPTGEKTTENIQYQPLMTKDGLIWVEPSKTTVEGLASLIDGLTARVSALENDRVTEAELAEAIKDFATDSELSEAIKDFVTDSELSEAIKDFATDSELSEAIKDFVTDSELSTAISGVEAKIPTAVSALTNDAGYLVAGDIAGKADKSDTYTKSEVDGAIDDAVKGILGEDVAEAYDTLKEIQDLLAGTDGERLDGLIEIADANKVAIETLTGDATVAGSVDAKIAAAVEPLATTEALNGVKATAEAAATKTYVDEELGKKVDASTYATDKATFALAADVEEALGEVDEALALKADADKVVSNETFTQFQADNTQAIAKAVSDHEATVAGTYATKAEIIDLETEIGNTYATKATTYTKDEIDGKKFVDETALATTLAGYQTVAPEGETYAYASDIESAVSALTNGAIQEAKAAAEAANTAASNAQGTADGAAQAAAANTGEIATLKQTVSGHTTTINEHGGKISTLEGAANTQGSAIEGLTSRVAANETAIAKKAEQSDLTALTGRVTTAEGAITTINDVTLPEMNRVIGTKANAANVYTKDEITGIVGATKPADKTIMDLIAEAQAAATYDDTTIKERVKTIEDDYLKAADKAELAASIKGITDDYLKAADKAELAASIKGITDDYLKAADKTELDTAIKTLAGEGNTSTVKANAAAIAVINGADTGKSMREVAGEEALKIVDGAPEAYDTLKEVAAWIGSDTTGAAAMAADIAKNKEAIEDIYTPASGESAASGVLVDEIARVEGKIGENKVAIDAINHADTGILATAKKYADDSIKVLTDESTGILATAKGYTDDEIEKVEEKITAINHADTGILATAKKYADDEIAKIPVADGDTITVDSDKKMSVSRVSVDLLDDTGIELILFGGDSGYKAPTEE